MDREAANWLAVIERENRTVPLFVRKSSNDIQLGKVANEHDFLSAFASFLCVYGVLLVPCSSPKRPAFIYISGSALGSFSMTIRSEVNRNARECYFCSTLASLFLFQCCTTCTISIIALHTFAVWRNGIRKYVTWRHFNFLLYPFFRVRSVSPSSLFHSCAFISRGFFFTSLGRPELMREKNPSLRIKQNQYSIDTCKMVPLLGVILTTVLIKSATPNASPDPMHTLLCIGNEHERATVWFLVPSIQTIIDTLTAYWNLA